MILFRVMVGYTLSEYSHDFQLTWLPGFALWEEICLPGEIPCRTGGTCELYTTSCIFLARSWTCEAAVLTTKPLCHRWAGVDIDTFWCVRLSTSAVYKICPLKKCKKSWSSACLVTGWAYPQNGNCSFKVCRMRLLFVCVFVVRTEWTMRRGFEHKPKSSPLRRWWWNR